MLLIFVGWPWSSQEVCPDGRRHELSSGERKLAARSWLLITGVWLCRFNRVSGSKPTVDSAGTHDACLRRHCLNPDLRACLVHLPCVLWGRLFVVAARFKEVFYDDTSLAIVMEYASGGTLDNCLRLRTSLPEEDARR